MDFVDWILSELDNRGMSRAELSGLSGITKGNLSNVLNRKQGYGAAFRLGIAKAFGMDINSLPLDDEAGVLVYPAPQSNPVGLKELIAIYSAASEKTREQILTNSRALKEYDLKKKRVKRKKKPEE